MTLADLSNSLNPGGLLMATRSWLAPPSRTRRIAVPSFSLSKHASAIDQRSLGEGQAMNNDETNRKIQREARERQSQQTDRMRAENEARWTKTRVENEAQLERMRKLHETPISDGSVPKPKTAGSTSGGSGGNIGAVIVGAVVLIGAGSMLGRGGNPSPSALALQQSLPSALPAPIEVDRQEAPPIAEAPPAPRAEFSLSRLDAVVPAILPESVSQPPPATTVRVDEQSLPSPVSATPVPGSDNAHSPPPQEISLRDQAMGR